MKKIFIIIIIIIVFGTNEMFAETIDFSEFVTRVAILNDCYFTIEQRNCKGNKTLLSNIDKIEWKENPGDIDEAMDYLIKCGVKYHYSRNERTPCVIHIIENDLSNNPLDTMIAKFEYEGTLQKLVDKFSNTRIQSGISQGGGASGGGVAQDFITVVKIDKVINTNVRNILSCYLPLSRYNRILWAAVIDESEDCLAKIYYYSPLIKIENWLSDEEIVSSDDFNALKYKHYLVNNSMALQVCQEVLEKKRNYIRWALILLGDINSEESLKEIIKYIDYKYCRYGIVEEAYPALLAINKIGRNSVRVLLESLINEDDILRKKLMIYAIFKFIVKEDAIRELIVIKNKEADKIAIARIDSVIEYLKSTELELNPLK